MKFSRIELRDLFIAWILISIAFAILFSGTTGLFSSINTFILYLILSLLTVGISFLLHELMHKFLAQKYGLEAEFRAFYPALFLAIILSFVGFIIAAPGAVIINGRTTKARNGKISLAGPLTNAFLAFIFLIFLLVFGTTGIFGIFLSLGLSINSLIALFNLIPFSIFDGKKIYDWNKTIYFIVLILTAILFISSFFFNSPLL